MSRRYCKSSGGIEPNKVSSDSQKLHEAKPETERATSDLEEYRRRLRPRPTKQTKYFGTLTHKQKAQNSFKANAGAAFSKVAIKRRGDLVQNSCDKAKFLKKNPKVPPDCNLGCFFQGSNFKEKLATDFHSHHKTDIVQSNHLPVNKFRSSKSSPGTKPTPTCPRLVNRLSLITKPTKSKSRRLSNTLPKSKRQISSEKISAQSDFEGKKATSKTGSCASNSRRGSERGRHTSSVAGSSDHTLPNEECRTDRCNNSVKESSGENKFSTNHTSSPITCTEREDARVSEEGATANGPNAGTSSNNDTESDEFEISRLQALLEARGLPPHFFGNLGPRMHQMLNRSMGSGINMKAQQYLQGMQAFGDESQQLQSVIGMCQLLVMGNEETLAGFPVKSAVAALIHLLKMDHNFDLMNHASRALTYMLEALPRSSSVVADAIPVFLEKLQVIQCMDVAEQSLTALDVLSRHHAPAILSAGGHSSCLLYIDFFSLPAQRSALSIAANCCLAIGMVSNTLTLEDEYTTLIKNTLPLLSRRLLHHDKKCVESVCLCFIHLVENYQQDLKILKEIAENDLFSRFQQLLVATPQLLSSNIFIMVIHTITIMCSKVQYLANKLVRGGIAETLKYLLCGTASEMESGQDGLVPRSPQELFEITSLIVVLLPKLPKHPLFNINFFVWNDDLTEMNGKFTQAELASWQWKNENGQWQPYILHDSRMIEVAYCSGEKEVNLVNMNRSCTVDFETMQQINSDTGMSHCIQRVTTPCHSASLGSKFGEFVEGENDAFQSKDSEDLSQFIKLLFSVLYEVYSSSAGFMAIRHRCLHALQRMVYYSKPKLLSNILCHLSVSSHISSMLSSQDYKVIVGALQLSEMLMQKLPDVFAEMFQREGVLYEIKKLSELSHPLQDIEHEIPTLDSVSFSPRNDMVTSTVKTRTAPQSPHCSSTVPPLVKAKVYVASAPTRNVDILPGLKKKLVAQPPRKKRSSSFLSSLNPTKWVKSSVSTVEKGSNENVDVSDTSSTSSQCLGVKKKVSQKLNQNSLDICRDSSETVLLEEWVKIQATKFLRQFFTNDQETDVEKTNVLEKLTKIARHLSVFSINQKNALQYLRELSVLIRSVDISSFELLHSGLVTSLLHFLTMPNPQNSGKTERDYKKNENTTNTAEMDLHTRIRFFLNIFAELPTSPMAEILHLSFREMTPLRNLVKKLNQCVGQLEQFPVKNHNLMSEGSQVLHILSTRQLKCQLQRHPQSHNVKQWLGGPVKVDPLVQVHAIERYLIARGYGMKSDTTSLEPESHVKVQNHLEEDSDNEVSENEEWNIEDSRCYIATESKSQCSEVGNTAACSSSDFVDLEEGKILKTSAEPLHKLEFYIGPHKLPYHITVYQAVQQYSWGPSISGDQSFSENLSSTETENSLIWNKTHVITYKSIGTDDEKQITTKMASKSNKKLRSTVKQGRMLTKRCKPNDLVWEEGIPPLTVNPLDGFLVSKLPQSFSTVDPCTEVLCLLRVLHAINRYWHFLYSVHSVHVEELLVPLSEFINCKVDAKCTRQLQDPLMLFTGQMTPWLQEVAIACPFLLSFETRHLLFKITAFDRDRGLQHLLDIGAGQDFTSIMSNSARSGDVRSQSRFMPRLEKKKCSVSRHNLLPLAEKIMFEYGNSKAVLEVDFEGEVGTGLGPTLEFFTLTSKELQNSELNLWREEDDAGQLVSPHDDITSIVDQKEKTHESFPDKKYETLFCHRSENDITFKDTSTPFAVEYSAVSKSLKTKDKDFVTTSTGLFPKPLGKNAKLSQIVKIKAKFRFVGIFLAKSLMDGRMADLPLSTACHKWLLGEEHSFCGLDLNYVDTGLAHSFNKMKKVAHEADVLAASGGSNLDSVKMEGCSIEDIGLEMHLPGYPNVELMKGGRNIPVTIHNLDKYLKLITYWTLCEGTRRQFEAMREGFESVMPLSNLKYFFPEELDQLFCGSRYQTWNVQELSEMCHPDHGYTQDSPTVKNLYHILSTYNHVQQRNFLQFVTGCPHLPVGGFQALNPRLTIVRKTCDAENADEYLPSVMTCLNYLKLPEYSSETVMRVKLELAILEGQKSFLLS